MKKRLLHRPPNQSFNQPLTKPSNHPPVCVILDDIRSGHNVGSIFRTADALGVGKIYLAGYTPSPEDKFGRINKEIAKVALGAEKAVSWKMIKNVSALIKKLKTKKYKIVAVEQHARAKDYKNFKFGESGFAGCQFADCRAAFIFGNEVCGLSEKILSVCDEIVQIPMRGKKESLNVSVAFGIALSRILNL